MSTAVPVVVEQDAGEAWWFGGGLFTFKVTSEQSGGASSKTPRAGGRPHRCIRIRGTMRRST
jgi:hypothetical protein